MRFILALALLLFAAPAQATTYEMYKTAVLRGVDKITGRVGLYEVGLDEATRFGTLYITARSCQKTPPEETPEAAAFLEIDEVKPGVTAKRWFTGWMFASSPALSPLQHPVYDVWVVDCKYKVSSPVDDGSLADEKAAVPVDKAPASKAE